MQDGSVKIIPGTSLRRICQLERQHDLNRQHPVEFEETIEDDALYPIVFSMPHEHRKGQYVGDILPHYRCVVMMRHGASQFDILAEMFDTFPVTVISKEHQDV